MKKLLPLIFFSFSLSAAAPLGETLFNGNCITCHTISVPNSAPSTKELQARYKKTYESKEAFVSAMATWIIKPNAKTALMPEAISKYGLMPELGYDKQTLEEIASYLYDVRLGQ